MLSRRKRKEKTKKEEDMDTIGKSLRTSTVLDPISPEVLESNLLLDRALKHLGLRRVWRRSYISAHSGFVVLDKDNREYRRVKDALDSFDNLTINTLDELLDTAWFEHYYFSLVSNPQNYRLVQNPFHNMTKEELAVKLDLLEA